MRTPSSTLRRRALGLAALFAAAAVPALRVAQLEPALTMAQGDID